jgi:SAM-dependent methyltransferase
MQGKQPSYAQSILSRIRQGAPHGEQPSPQDGKNLRSKKFSKKFIGSEPMNIETILKNANITGDDTVCFSFSIDPYTPSREREQNVKKIEKINKLFDSQPAGCVSERIEDVYDGNLYKVYGDNSAVLLRDTIKLNGTCEIDSKRLKEKNVDDFFNSGLLNIYIYRRDEFKLNPGKLICKNEIRQVNIDENAYLLLVKKIKINENVFQNIGYSLQLVFNKTSPSFNFKEIIERNGLFLEDNVIYDKKILYHEKSVHNSIMDYVSTRKSYKFSEIQKIIRNYSRSKAKEYPLPKNLKVYHNELIIYNASPEHAEDLITTYLFNEYSVIYNRKFNFENEIQTYIRMKAQDIEREIVRIYKPLLMSSNNKERLYEKEAVSSDIKAVSSGIKALSIGDKAVPSDTKEVSSGTKFYWKDFISSAPKAVSSETKAVSSETKAVSSETKAVSSEIPKRWGDMLYETDEEEEEKKEEEEENKENKIDDISIDSVGNNRIDTNNDKDIYNEYPSYVKSFHNKNMNRFRVSINDGEDPLYLTISAQKNNVKFSRTVDIPHNKEFVLNTLGEKLKNVSISNGIKKMCVSVDKYNRDVMNTVDKKTGKLLINTLGSVANINHIIMEELSIDERSLGSYNLFLSLKELLDNFSSKRKYIFSLTSDKCLMEACKVMELNNKDFSILGNNETFENHFIDIIKTDFIDQKPFDANINNSPAEYDVFIYNSVTQNIMVDALLIFSNLVKAIYYLKVGGDLILPMGESSMAFLYSVYEIGIKLFDSATIMSPNMQCNGTHPYFIIFKGLKRFDENKSVVERITKNYQMLCQDKSSVNDFINEQSKKVTDEYMSADDILENSNNSIKIREIFEKPICKIPDSENSIRVLYMSYLYRLKEINIFLLGQYKYINTKEDYLTVDYLNDLKKHPIVQSHVSSYIDYITKYIKEYKDKKCNIHLLELYSNMVQGKQYTVNLNRIDEELIENNYKNSEIEIEFKIKYKEFTKQLHDKLVKYFSFTAEPTTQEYTNYSYSSPSNVRETKYKNNSITIIKKKIRKSEYSITDSYLFNKMGMDPQKVRVFLSISSEEPFVMDDSKKVTISHKRQIKRTTFLYNPFIKVELSEVYTGDDETPTYEMEIECTGKKDLNLVGRVLSGNIHHKDKPGYYELRNIYTLVAAYRKRTENMSWVNMFMGIINRPINFRKNKMKNDFFAVTKKADGIRGLLIIAGDTIYLLTKKGKIVIKDGIGNNTDVVTILDCEVFNENKTTKYYAFDCLMYKSKPTINEWGIKRIGLVREVVDSLNNDNIDISIIAKKFIFTKNLEKDTRDCWNDSGDEGLRLKDIDGLIYINAYGSYIDTQYKFKQIDKLSIDFLVKETNDKKWELYSTRNGKEFLYPMPKSSSYTNPVYIRQELIKNLNIKNNKVIEFVVKNGNFLPYRNRTDVDGKIKPNAFNVVKENLEDIIANVTVDNLILNLKSDSTKSSKYDLINILAKNIVNPTVDINVDHTINIFSKSHQIAEDIIREGILLNKTEKQYKKVNIYTKDSNRLKQVIYRNLKNSSKISTDGMNIHVGTVNYEDYMDLSINIPFSTPRKYNLFPFVLNYWKEEGGVDSFLRTIDHICSNDNEKSTFIFFEYSILKNKFTTVREYDMGGGIIIKRLQGDVFEIYVDGMEKIILKKSNTIEIADKFNNNGFEVELTKIKGFSNAKMNNIIMKLDVKRIKVSRHVRQQDLFILKENEICPVKSLIRMITFNRESSIGDGSCLLHAIYKASLGDRYTNLRPKKKTALVVETRRQLSNKFDIKNYPTYMDFYTQEKIVKDIMNPIVHLCQEHIQFIMDTIGVNIIFIDSITKIPVINSFEYNMSNLFIFIYSIRESHYEPLHLLTKNGKKAYLFSKNNDIVQLALRYKKQYHDRNDYYSVLQLPKFKSVMKEITNLVMRNSKYNDATEFINYISNVKNISDKEFITELKNISKTIKISDDVSRPNNRSTNRSNEIARFIDNISNGGIQTYLDFGCGTGDITWATADILSLNPKNVFGIDVKEYEGVRKNIANFEVSTSPFLKYENDKFDLITANMVLHHVVDLKTTIRELARVLKPNGHLIIKEHNPHKEEVIEFSICLDYMHDLYDFVLDANVNWRDESTYVSKYKPIKVWDQYMEDEGLYFTKTWQPVYKNDLTKNPIVRFSRIYKKYKEIDEYKSKKDIVQTPSNNGNRHGNYYKTGNQLDQMKKYHGIVKKQYIFKSKSRPKFKKFPEFLSKVLDLGSGNGGDIGKYLVKKISKLFMVEPSLKNMNELVSRKNKIGSGKSDTTIYVINAQAENSIDISSKIKPFIKDVWGEGGEPKFDFINMFFILTFFFKNSEMLDSLIDTLVTFSKSSNNNKRGTVIMGTTMEGEKTYNYLQKLSMGETITTDHFSITKKYDKVKTYFGNEIEITIGDQKDSIVSKQIEYLACFDVFKKKMQDRGFRFIYKYDFNMKEAISDSAKHFLQFLPKYRQSDTKPYVHQELVNMKNISQEIYDFSNLNVGFEFEYIGGPKKF